MMKNLVNFGPGLEYLFTPTPEKNQLLVNITWTVGLAMTLVSLGYWFKGRRARGAEVAWSNQVFNVCLTFGLLFLFFALLQTARIPYLSARYLPLILSLACLIRLASLAKWRRFEYPNVQALDQKEQIYRRYLPKAKHKTRAGY